jgi:hypothetical protein
MFSTDSAMNIVKRLALGFLLILLLIGFAAHLLAPVSDTQHLQSEATCAFHQSINLSAKLQTAWKVVGVSPEPVNDNACALDLILKISHPPSL